MVVTEFRTVRRQQFRRFFQPSRVVICILPSACARQFNLITLCFSMYCSYKPPMIAVAINDRAASYSLLDDASEFVLSVPGQSLLDVTMYCGTETMYERDKARDLNLDYVESETVSVPGLRQAIANVELKKKELLKTGDHMILVGEVTRFAVNSEKAEAPLLSVGPDVAGYNVLLKKGIHRLAVVNRNESG